MYELLARTLRGIEWIAAAEIRAVLGVFEIARGHRELRFQLPELSPQSLDLGTVDDVFLVAAVVDGIGRARAGLTCLTGAATTVDLDALAEVVSRVRDVSDRSCDVVGSFLGRRNFSRYELEDAVGAALATAGGWAYRSRSAGAPARGSLSVRVHLEDTRATMACTRRSLGLWRCSWGCVPGPAWSIRSAGLGRFRSRRSLPAAVSVPRGQTSISALSRSRAATPKPPPPRSTSCARTRPACRRPTSRSTGSRRTRPGAPPSNERDL